MDPQEEIVACFSAWGFILRTRRWGKKGCRTGSVAAYVQRGNKSERFTVFARPPNSLAPFKELLRVIYKEAELSGCPNFHHF